MAVCDIDVCTEPSSHHPKRSKTVQKLLLKHYNKLGIRVNQDGCEVIHTYGSINHLLHLLTLVDIQKGGGGVSSVTAMLLVYWIKNYATKQSQNCTMPS